MSDAAVMRIFGAFAVLVGLVIGSFLNVCIVRLPEDRSVVVPRSHCPKCGTTLAPTDLVPVLSWVWLRGRCRYCHTPISAVYPLIEALSGMLAWLVFRRIVTGPQDLDLTHAAAFAVYFGFVGLLVVAAYVDVRHWIIPDQTSLYAIPFAIAGVGFLQWIGYEDWPAIGWRASVSGALIGASTLATASIVARWVLRREALGWGDVKLMGLIGAFVGPIQVMFLVLLPASLIGSVASLAHLAATRRRAYLPYGPSLALGAVLYLLWGDLIARTFFPGVALWMGLLDPAPVLH